MNYWLYRYRCWRSRSGLDRLDLPDVLRRHLDVPSRQSPSQPADRARFVVFDTEMTGLNAEDRLLSLGAVRIESARVNLADNFYEIVDPHRDIPTESILIHHIVPDMTEGRPHSGQIIPGFLDFIGSDVLVAHNARFDRDFLNREMLHHFGLPLQNPILDVMELAKANSDLRRKYHISGALEDHSLDGLADAFGLTLEDRHSAFGDALATGLIFLRLIKSLQRFGCSRVKHLMRLAAV